MYDLFLVKFNPEDCTRRSDHAGNRDAVTRHAARADQPGLIADLTLRRIGKPGDHGDSIR